MNPKQKTKTIKTAIAMLPEAKKYPVNIIQIRVEKEIINFEKFENEWYLKN